MRVSVFQTPYISQEKRGALEIFKWAVHQAIVADQAGFHSYWVGEHALEEWESIPNPELVIAAAARETENLILAPGSHIVPLHNPGSLAIQASWLSHILEGRYAMGIGAGAFPATFAIAGVPMDKNHEMTREAVQVMQKVWKGKPFKHEGEFFTSELPEDDPTHPFRDIRPYGGKMQINMMGMSPNSPTMQIAGEFGFNPNTVFSGLRTAANHWEVYSQAALAAGHTPSRDAWGLSLDAFVADTDKEARERALASGLADGWAEYVLPRYKFYNLLGGLIESSERPETDPADVDVEWLVDHLFFVGSPETVTNKLLAFQEKVGGFGEMLVQNYDNIDNPEPNNYSMELLGKVVIPAVNKQLDSALAGV